MGMSNKMKSEMNAKIAMVNAVLAAMAEKDIVAEVTGDGSFAVIVEVDNEKRVLNFVGTMKKNVVNEVAVSADEVLDNLVDEFGDKVAEREANEKIAAEKKALKLAEVEAKKVAKENEKAAKANKVAKAEAAKESVE
jgi:hypothetical protein